MRATRLIERGPARLVAAVGERVAVALLAAIDALWPVAPLRPATVPVPVGGPLRRRRTV